MVTRFWVEFVVSTDIEDTIIRRGYYEQSVLTILLSCQTLDLFGIEPNYVLKEVVFLEGQGTSGEAPHNLRIYVE
ncbi:hypothetical protein IKM_05589 [Bacillus mycoides]|nr:hypothetical protein IKM_05589 [Bacillus mycoides]